MWDFFCTFGTPQRVPSEGTVALCSPSANRGIFYYPHRYALLMIMKEPKFYLREYEPRKNSGIRGLSLRTEGAFGNAVFEGLHTPRSSLRLFHNRRMIFCLAKKSLIYLHMCKICCTFAPQTTQIKNYYGNNL